MCVCEANSLFMLSRADQLFCIAWVAEQAQTRGQLTRQLIPVLAGMLAFEQGWFSLIALRGPRPTYAVGSYSWTSFRQGPSGALIARKGEKTDWTCDLRPAICDIIVRDSIFYLCFCVFGRLLRFRTFLNLFERFCAFSNVFVRFRTFLCVFERFSQTTRSE